MIDRAYTKAEARYIPNGPGTTADMAHPTRTGDLVVFSLPAVPVRRGDPRHARRALGVLRPARLRAGRAEPGREREHARDVHRRRRRDPPGRGRERDCARSTSRRRSPTSSAFPSRSTRKGVVRLDLLDGERVERSCPLIGLTDFHGQLEPTTLTMDGRNVPVGGAPQLATMFDEEAAQLPKGSFLFASGDNVGASPANSGLLEDKPAIDVENAWGLRGHLVRQPRVRLRRRRDCKSTRRARTSRSWAPTSSTRTRCKNPDWVQGHQGVLLRQASRSA